MKYRKRPVVIEALCFVGGDDCARQICAWADTVQMNLVGMPVHAIEISTLEGTMRADIGDWIIRGVKGEYYPCKPDIFEATYEAVAENIESGATSV